MRVESLTVRDRSLVAVVRVAEGMPLRTSAIEDVKGRSLRLLPGLARHRCENDAGASFTEELADTEVAHLFEHVVIELMALAGSPRTLHGSTAWDFRRDGRGVFRVTLEFDDDLVCIGAVDAGRRVMAHLLDGAIAPDVPVEVERLRRARSR